MGAKKNTRHRQSNLSKALSSSNQIGEVHNHFFKHLSPGEIRRSVPNLANHRHFSSAITPNRSMSKIYVRYTPPVSLEKSIAWCLGLLEQHRLSVQIFLDAQEQILDLLLSEEYTLALDRVRELDAKIGISAWGITLQGSLLAITDPDARRAYITDSIAAAEDNRFFKALIFHLTNRFDDPEIHQSESRFFELKIKRSFSGELLQFLMYKLVPYNVEFNYDFESILNYEKNSSPVDIFLCLVDFLIFNLETDSESTRELSVRTLADLKRHFHQDVLNDLSVAYGQEKPLPISPDALSIIDLYTAGNYDAVCTTMTARGDLQKYFGLVEIWAKSLARSDSSLPNSLPRILGPLRDIAIKAERYEKSRAELLSYCHAFGMFKWFRELRYLLERETKFYDATVNQQLNQVSSLLSTLTTPAKIEILENKGFITPSEREGLLPTSSVTARLFSRMKAPLEKEPSDAELTGIETNRQLKYRATWNISRGNYEPAISLLKTQTHSPDVRVAHDASRALVECYRAVGEIEKAADVYVDAILSNINLLSVYDTNGLAEACKNVISTSTSISVPIVFSIYSRYIGDSYDAALKYSFECFLRNIGKENPLDLSEELNSPSVAYFLRYICTPEVMKLYLYFDSPKKIELCRIEVCNLLLKHFEGDEELIFEVKERTRRLVLKEASNQVQASRIFSDSNLLSSPSSSAFRALYDRYSVLRVLDFSSSPDELSLNEFLAVLRRQPVLLENSHTLHIQDIVLNEKNSVFLKLLKLVRDEFVFGEKGLNVYLSTRIRHGHFPNTFRKPLLANFLLASKATDTAGYKLNKGWQHSMRPAVAAETALEQAIIDFSLKFNELVDEVNDNWLRIFTIDPDISGLSGNGEAKKSVFNYSVSAVEAFRLQQELDPTASYTDLVSLATKWFWERTEFNLKEIRLRLEEEMSAKLHQMLDDLGKSVISKWGIENLGEFPDALVRARNGITLAFETVLGWFARSRGTSIQNFELDIPVQIASKAVDVSVSFTDETERTWDGSILNPLVDAFYILFENAVSKSHLPKEEINLHAKAEYIGDSLALTISNRCMSVVNLNQANEALEKYRSSISEQLITHGAQKEGGSGFLKLRRLLEKDINIGHQIYLGYSSDEEFQVRIQIPITECERVSKYENTSDRR